MASVKGEERAVELIPDSLRAEMMMDPCVYKSILALLMLSRRSFLQPYFPSV